MSTPARSYRGKSAHERVTERRARLVDAAIEMLAAHGEAGATMTAICNHARLTERYFYESFPNRSAVLRAAVDHVATEIADEVLPALAGTAASPEERVRAAMTSFTSYVLREPAKGLVIVVQAGIVPALRSRRHELLEFFADLVATEAAALYGEQAWPPAQAHIHGLFYVAGLSELYGAWLTGRIELSENEIVEISSDLFAAISLQP